LTVFLFLLLQELLCIGIFEDVIVS
jgi:hypothetical protein